MIRHILKLVIRDLGSNRIIAFINILGLALALGTSYLILLFVIHECSFNSFHKEKDRIYRVLSEYNWVQNEWELVSSSSLLLADVLQKEYPEVEKATRVVDYELFYGGQYVKKDEQYIHETSFLVVDPSFFQIFSFPILRGDKDQFLQDPYDIVISEKIANKYFGDENPVGRTLTIRNYEGEREYMVEGVFKDIPGNSTLQADLIGNVELTLSFYGDRGWSLSNVQTFLLLENSQDRTSMEEKLEDFYKKNHPDRKSFYHLQSLKDIHFHSYHLSWYQYPKGDLKKIYLLCVIGLIILLIPGVNYFILATGRGISRYMEIGIRKVVGASQRSIAFQVTSESVLILIIALPLAMMISELMLPTFNKLLNTGLEIDYFSNLPYFGSLILITLLFGLISGSNIALFLSRFQPEHILKYKFTSTQGNKSFRRVLIVLQLCIFLTLFIFTGVLYRQLKFIENRDLGFSPEANLAIVPPHDHHLYSCLPYVEAIRELPGVEAVSEICAGVFTTVFSQLEFPQEGNSDSYTTVQSFEVDAHFVRTYGIKILEGRDFSGNLASDSGRILINQTGIETFGFEDPIGKMITDSYGKQFEIMGVIADFNIGSLHEKIPPLIVRIRPGESMVCQVAVKVNQAVDIQQLLASLSQNWDEFGPGGRFEYFFMDERFSSLYEEDRRFARTFGIFTLLAIVLASLGLFGFSIFSSFQRIKEVGIRKAFGASTNEITQLILKEYILLLGIANFISWPLSWFFAQTWLHNYAYRTDIGVIPFLLAALVAIFVLLLTIGYNTRTMAESNPVISLKYE